MRCYVKPPEKPAVFAQNFIPLVHKHGLCSRFVISVTGLALETQERTLSTNSDILLGNARKRTRYVVLATLANQWATNSTQCGYTCDTDTTTIVLMILHFLEIKT